MKGKIRRCVSILAAVTVLMSGLQVPVSVQAQVEEQQTGESQAGQLYGENGVTVSKREEFMDALQKRQSPIIVTGLISIGDEAESDGRMRPVMLPENTVIQGSTPESGICSRGPIQLEGDGVCFQNIKLTFESSNALGSVPHREIFLAGHSLILDQVNTYLKGGEGLGGLGGTEKELLPTVYAGGFSNTAIGVQASLTVRNSSDETMFQAIYMGHEAGDDNKVPYQGSSVLNLDAKALVRDAVDTSLNSKAEININGTENQYARAGGFYGNEDTVLTLSGVSIENARAESVGSVVLKDKACMSSAAEELQNVTLMNGACLDFNGATDAVIAGNFTGVENPAEERGILVLNRQGTLTINGKVTGTTQFQTGHRLFPGGLVSDKTYISTNDGSGMAENFVLAQKSIDQGYELQYNAGKWTVCGGLEDFREIGRIDVSYAPEKVDLRKIQVEQDVEDVIPDPGTYFEITWYDENGEAFSDSDILNNCWFYDPGYVILIRTDYWESDAEDVLDKTDWAQLEISLMASEDHPGRYYLQALEGADTGNYTFLFCSDYVADNLYTAADVKKLKGIVKAEKQVLFYDQDLPEPEKPEHQHEYQSTVTKEPACTESGIRTYTCSCGDKYTEEIVATGHQEVIDPAEEPTETTEGKTEGSHCGVCGAILKAQESIPALGVPKPEEPGHTHTYGSAVTKAPTCTERGIRTYTCSCGDKYTEEIAATGHQEVIDPAVEPTETTEGKTEGSRCGVCGAILKAQESIPALGVPKPEEPGHTHTYGSAVTKAPTCTERGIRTYTCSCGDKYTEEIAATGHQEVIDPAVEPTETTEGKTEGSRCGVCGAILKAQESIPALGVPKPEEPGHTHTYGSAVTKAPTCTEPGVKTYTCSCGDQYTEEIPASNHRYIEKCIPASMKVNGKVQQVCSKCAEIKSETVIESPWKIIWSQTDFTYNGRAKTPTAIVKDRKGRRLTSGRDYQISYPAGRKRPGVYTAVLKFCGNYSGRVTETFMIRPQDTILKKAVSKSRGIQVTWKRQITPIDGYQIQYCTNKDFKGRTAKITTAPQNVSVKKISKLKGKKKYYVRIRTYKNVKVNGKSRKLYSDWSDRKTAVTKK